MSIRIYGNRELKTLPGELTRPTAAKVREALFNIWRTQVLGCCWLDLCAGSGAMGAEALCRGAQSVVGIEQAPEACRVMAQNWQKVAKPEQHYEILKGDVLKQLKRLSGRSFDLVYFDPPYASGLYQPVLEALVQVNVLHPGSEIAVEHNVSHWQPNALNQFEIIREKRYGITNLTFLALTSVV
jgi:16S rRNA (guanine966-N2)-methyltransferase